MRCDAVFVAPRRWRAIAAFELRLTRNDGRGERRSFPPPPLAIAPTEPAMPLTVAVQMDPIETHQDRRRFDLRAPARGAGARARLLYYTPDGSRMRDGQVTAEAQPLRCATSRATTTRLGEAERIDLASVDVVLMRQDPPFDMAYITATHLLERIHPHTLVVNDPAQVRNAPEKLFVTRFPAADAADADHARQGGDRGASATEFGEIVMKPLLRPRRRRGVTRRARGPEFRLPLDLFATTFREPWVVQRFLPQVSEGDKRIILVDGVAAGAVNRVPAANDIRSNMVRGGAAQATDLTPREREICETIGPELQRARPHLRRHRRDRRLPHRDQRHLADRHPRDQEARRPRPRGGDLGRDRGQGAARRRHALTETGG